MQVLDDSKESVKSASLQHSRLLLDAKDGHEREQITASADSSHRDQERRVTH